MVDTRVQMKVEMLGRLWVALLDRPKAAITAAR